jgi:hypothetical protein
VLVGTIVMKVDKNVKDDAAKKEQACRSLGRHERLCEEIGLIRLARADQLDLALDELPVAQVPGHRTVVLTFEGSHEHGEMLRLHAVLFEAVPETGV